MENGYSGTPLAKKLGLRAGQKLWQVGMPASVRALIEAEVPGLKFSSSLEPPIEFAHVFTKSRAALEGQLALLRIVLAPAGILWVS